MQLDLAHAAFEAEQEPVIEYARMVQTISVGDQRIDERAEIQQVVPVAIVAGQPRDLDGEDDADMAQTHLADESFETDASNASATDPEVIIDHYHLGPRPPQVDGPIHQTVLAALAL